VISIERSSFRIKSLIFYFKNQWELALEIANKRFERLKPKYVAYPIQWGARCKALIAEIPFKSISDHFPAFPAGNWFWDL
jgi:hypothetical protein